jgi:monoamine oxidase
MQAVWLHLKEPGVIVIGVAGLSAACDLARRGVVISILEARGRIGGRVFTERDAKVDVPIELGAEFIHGRPPKIWQPLQKAKIAIHCPAVTDFK